MVRPTFADPRTTFAFMRIFGSEERKDVLVAFLNDILDLDEPRHIVAVELLPPEHRPAVAELELSIVDVTCTDARGVTYVVKMQVLLVEGFEKRVVCDVPKAYVNKVSRGELYPAQDDVVGITICDFELWPESGEEVIPMLSRWRRTEEQTEAKRPVGQIRLVFLELQKYDTSRPPQTTVEKWAYFFREADKLTVVPEVLSEHPFIDALEAARTARFTVAEWDAHIQAGMALQDRRGALSVAEKRGMRRGLQQALRSGEQQGMALGIAAVCNVLGIELTPERRRHLESLDTGGLTALLDHLQERKAWP